RDLQVVAGVVCLATILAVAFLFIRPVIVAPLRAFRESVARLAQGEKVALPGMERGDEIGALARSMEAIYERGVEAARIRIALDNSSALMMVADAEHRIGYVNDALKKLLGEHLDAIRTRFPDFDPEALVGANIDIFHAQPDKTRGEVEALTDEHRARIRLGDSIFTLAVSPVVSETGERLGSVVEWRDMTVELRIQEQIDQAVGAAVDGDFTQRVDATGAPDQLRIVAEKINTLLSSVDAGVSDTSAAVEALSNGDLTHEMTGSHRGAFATLQQNVNASIAKLSEVVGAIHGAAHRISMRTDNIRDGASQLSSRTESQASTLEETAATMEEITATTKESASSAANASSMVGTALSDAEASGRIVGEAVEAMQRIEASATRISEIISVIDAIAFQTNLLALNAAVEAARAGDAGKGFAVVAAEVRALAQRAGDAAKDIRELIEESGAHVTSGVSHVHQTGDALTKIIDDVKSVTDRIREISSAASEQASGIAEITSAVNSMDEMTQQNAAMAEQSANGAGELSDEAQKLMQLVSHFRARGGEQPAAAADVTNASAPAAMAAASVGARSSAAASEEWREF
ncbi:MAG: methyl-accepting chemotaxis protein, partial [Pseudomonadota bacterium]